MIHNKRVRLALPALIFLFCVFGCARSASETNGATAAREEAGEPIAAGEQIEGSGGGEAANAGISADEKSGAPDNADDDTAGIALIPAGISGGLNGNSGGSLAAGSDGVSAREAIPEPRFVVSPGSARPGEPVTVACLDSRGDTAPGGRNLQAALLDSAGRRLTKALFFDLSAQAGEFAPGAGSGGEPAFRAAVVAIPSTARPGNGTIRVELTGGGVIRDIPFTIDGREFEAETIHLNPQNTEIRTAPDPQKTAESERLWAILSRTGTEVYHPGVFAPPVESTRRTSVYGSRRVYQYSTGSTDTTIHAGVDIGVPTGTEIRACGAGKVVLAQSRIVTGNTVIIEHLPGLYSLYYHLDSIAAAEGALVETGELLGLSGSTGLATGPHLHWEIRVSGENADPDAFLARPVLDKKAIFDTLTTTQ